MGAELGFTSMHDSRDIANCILDIADKSGTPISNMAINKLIYFLNGWYLADFERELCFDKFEAWEHGPVLPKVYHSFKSFGKNSIATRAERFNPSTRLWYYQDYKFTDDELGYIDFVFKSYVSMSAVSLSKMSHVEEGPWDLVRNPRNGEVFPKGIIPSKLIRDYFLRIRRRADT